MILEDDDDDAPTVSAIAGDTINNSGLFGSGAAANNEDDAIFAWAMQWISACTTIREFIHV